VASKDVVKAVIHAAPAEDQQACQLRDLAGKSLHTAQDRATPYAAPLDDALPRFTLITARRPFTAITANAGRIMATPPAAPLLAPLGLHAPVRGQCSSLWTAYSCWPSSPGHGRTAAAWRVTIVRSPSKLNSATLSAPRGDRSALIA
jgi:hypothetical protein